MGFQKSNNAENPISGDPSSPLLVYHNGNNNRAKDTKATCSDYLLSRKLVLVLITVLMVVGLVVGYVFGNIKGKENLRLPDGDLPLCATHEALKAALVVADGDISKPRKVARGVAEGFSAKSNGPLKEDEQPSCIWTRDMLSWQKSGFHFQTKKNWMSDPNGPLYYKGWYHIFYQYNPQAAVWGNIVWGHAISTDLIHWRELPFALEPDQWYDAFGVFTGSATVLPDGQVVMIFTSGRNVTEEQTQSLAYPADLSDPLLTKWIKYPGNPVLIRPPSIGPIDFRDPSSAWLTSEGKWRMTIGSMYNRTSIALVYDTIDFKTFELRETLLHSFEGTGMWECLDFFPISTTSDDGLDTSYNGPNIKHVVKASVQDLQHDTYAIGTYDDEAGKWVPDDPTIDVSIGLRYDYGTFYASKSFYDEEKKRRVLWGFVHEADNEVTDVLRGWASIYNIPRTIMLDRQTGTNLLVWPVEEVDQLRGKRKAFNNVSLKPGSVVPLDVSSASQLDIEAEFEVDTKTLEEITTNEELYTCSSSGGAAQRGGLGPFGVLVLSTKSLSELTPVYFYIVKGSDGSLTTHFCSDQSRSSLAYDVIKGIFGSTVPVLQGEKLTMRILVDHSIVESFAQRGRTNIISRVYPTEAIYDETNIFLFNNATDATVKASIQVWQMGSAPYI